jgi:hypothetical protein
MDAGQWDQPAVETPYLVDHVPDLPADVLRFGEGFDPRVVPDAPGTADQDS